MNKAGFVTFVGRPNVGKSTLLNMIMGEKIAIMSSVAQTTRTTIQAIKTTEKGQIIIVDTPGIHKPKDALGTFMNAMATTGAAGVDVVVILFPADEAIGKGDEYVINQFQQLSKNIKIIAVISKIDKVSKEKLLHKLMAIEKCYEFDAIIPVSAKKRDNLPHLEEIIYSMLPESPNLFEDEQRTTQSDTFVVREFIREKVLHLTKEEIPHAIAVVVDLWEEEDNVFVIHASIIVERKSQKAIIIGKQGQLIKEIRKQAERDLKRHFGQKVILELWVKTEKDWRSKTRFLHAYGYNIDDYQK